MKRKIITFIGAWVAVLFLFSVMSLIDVSAPPTPTPYSRLLLTNTIVATIFVLVEFLSKRPARDNLLRIVLDAGLVCFVASIVTFGGFYLILAVLGYAELQNLRLELFSIVFLGGLLFVSSFIAISMLRGVAHIFELPKEAGE